MFIHDIIPYNTHTKHIQPSSKIWFETEHFENLGFLGPRLRFSPVTSRAKHRSREKLSWIFEILKLDYDPFYNMKKTQKSF